MTKVVFACLLVALSAAVGPAEARDPTPLSLQKGARIGIVNMMDAEVTHFHASKVLAQSFFKTPPVAWQIDSMLSDAVSPRLTQLGLVPVATGATDSLMRSRDDTFVNSSVVKGLPKETARQFAELATSNHLDALIVLAPGLNNSSQAGSAVRKSLPEYLRGWGFVTGDTNDKPSLFNMTQLLLIGVSPEGATLNAREWGGAYSADWVDYTPPPDLKQFPQDQLDRLQPLFEKILSQQANRLMDWITVAR